MIGATTAIASPAPTPLPKKAMAAKNSAIQAAISLSSRPAPPLLPPPPQVTTSNPDDSDDEDMIKFPMPGEEEEEEEEDDEETVSPRMKTVFDDPASFDVVHPTCSSWQLWFDSASKQDKAKSWDDALVKVSGFDSIESFWGLYNNIVPPSLIHPNSNYYLFKKGIKPAWEDASNANGGKFSVQLPRGKFSESIDNYWLYTMLAAIGETLDLPASSTSDAASTLSASSSVPSALPDNITGVILSSRKAFYRISIWTRTSSTDDGALVRIGKAFKYDVLGFDDARKISDKDKVSTQIEFISHHDSQAKYGTKVTKWSV